MVKNPNYESLLARYDHHGGVDGDVREEIPIHVLLGAGEYAAINTSTPQRVGSPGQPMAEKTHLGWTMMSPKQEDQESRVFLTQSALRTALCFRRAGTRRFTRD